MKYYLCSILLSCSIYVNAQIAFGPMQVISKYALWANAIVTVDFDNDGDIDVISASEKDDRIAWYENSNNTFFLPQKNITTNANEVTKIIVSDLNKDGYTDVVFSSDYEVAWFENDGSGNFGAKNQIYTSKCYSIFACDIDNDADSDILVADFNDDKIVWLENIGLGNFDSIHVVSDLTDGANFVTAADVNGDGEIDIISGSRNDHKLCWYQNDGNGNFGNQNVISMSIGNIKDIIPFDINTDGYIDLLIADFGNSLDWVINNGNAISWNSISISTNYDMPYAIDLADIDGDGDIDIGSVEYNADNIVWYENDGSNLNYTEHLITNKCEDCTDILLQDINNDGFNELIFTSKHFNKVGYFNNSNGILTNVTELTSHGEGLNCIGSFDVDEDGDNDILATSSEDDKLAWFENSGLGVFNKYHIISDSLNGANSFFSCDLDGDTDIDILASAQYDYKVFWFENTSSGNFLEKPQVFGSSGYIKQVIATDIDNDGDNDPILVALDVRFNENDGNGNFNNSQNIINNVQAESAFFSDLDGNGYNDLIYCNYYIVSWILNSGNGNFSEAMSNHLPVSSPSRALSFDMDLDGDNDLITASSGDNKIAWSENNGNAFFGSQKVITTNATEVNDIYICDLDNDNDLDILAAITGEDILAYYENYGNGLFSLRRTISSNVFNVNNVYASDLDGDGDLDVIATILSSYSGDRIVWFENLTETSVTKTSKSEIILYPNPVKDILRIKNAESSKIFIYNSLGICVHNYKFSSSESEIDLGNLPNGTYTIIIKNNKKTYQEKVCLVR